MLGIGKKQQDVTESAPANSIHQLFIAGKPCPSANGAVFEDINPTTRQAMAHVSDATVSDMDAAIDHIRRFGSDHTDTIVTENAETAAEFTQRVQSSCTLVNASTRFNDGFQLGMGAEIGISTSRVHAYGPMGLEELTSQRFVVEGAGHVR